MSQNLLIHSIMNHRHGSGLQKKTRLCERLRIFLTILNFNKKSNMNKIEQILVLLLFSLTRGQ